MPSLKKVQTWIDLTPHERSLLLQACVMLPIVALSVHLAGLRRTQLILTQFTPQISTTPHLDSYQVKRTAYLVGIAARYSKPWSNCLKRSLVLWYLLRRQGIMSDLRIGVRRDRGEFQAHAWIEYEGMVLNDSPSVYEHYIAFEQSLNL